VAGIADSLADGVERAIATIASGAARAKVDQLVEYTKKFAA